MKTILNVFREVYRFDGHINFTHSAAGANHCSRCKIMLFRYDRRGLDGRAAEKAEKFVGMLETMGHESPVEHVTFTFGIAGVSRSLLAQITRHRIASFSVQSQRYVRKNQFTYVTPPAIAADEAAAALYHQTMEQTVQAYNALADRLQATYYPQFLAEGCTEKAARSKAEKKAIEDARYVLPNACETKMMVTMNVRSLRHFFQLRCCNRAQWEIRDLATQMLKLCCEAAPALFRHAGPACCQGGCPEGKMTCGQMAAVRERFAALHAAPSTAETR